MNYTVGLWLHFPFFCPTYSLSVGYVTLAASTGIIIQVSYILSQVTTTHLKLGHPHIWFVTESRRLDHLTMYQDSSHKGGIRATWPILVYQECWSVENATFIGILAKTTPLELSSISVTNGEILTNFDLKGKHRHIRLFIRILVVLFVQNMYQAFYTQSCKVDIARRPQMFFV